MQTPTCTLIRIFFILQTLNAQLTERLQPCLEPFHHMRDVPRCLITENRRSIDLHTLSSNLRDTRVQAASPHGNRSFLVRARGEYFVHPCALSI